MDKIIIIPLGGLGTRFKHLGYNLPKPLINVMGTPIIYWLLNNIDLSDIQYVFIPYNKKLKKYNFEDRLKKDFDNINFKFHCLEHDTLGAAHTLQIALNHLNLKQDVHVMCIDSDNFYTENFIKKWNGNNMVITYEDNFPDSIFSYVKTDINNKITDIKEKNKISDNACTGVYAFNSAYKLLEYCNYVISNNIKEKGEFYTSIIISEMIKKNEPFYNHTISKKNYHCLGTPLQVKLFCSNFDNLCIQLTKNLMTPKRYCFDLDNTLVTYPKINGDYTTVDPIQKNIDMVRHLHKMGHTIIIYTARRMKTHQGNVGKVVADIGKITFDTLDKFDIPYDEIVFGKPIADIYVDDAAISAFDNLEKELGYHNTNTLPRNFNTIEQTSLNVIRKKSSDLTGEIYYYLNIPSDVKRYFPSLLSYDENCRWYDIEKVNGIMISKLYLSEELTINILKKIMDCIESIQNSVTNINQKVDIYANYNDKLYQRYLTYNYSNFKNHHDVYNTLFAKLNEYKKNNMGKIKVIHGDPVFTNILLDSYTNLKFIDMRGKLGNINSIYGDWLYDWAKLYQSLIGYDEILDDVDLDLTYKNSMIDFFRDQFIKKYSEQDFNNLKLITKSLLFTLIPLHNNEKCKKYYELIFSNYLE
jgi:capsule biosynthesis phosphatase